MGRREETGHGARKQGHAGKRQHGRKRAASDAGRLGRKQGKGKEFLCYFVFKTKFNFEPNPIQIEFKIHFLIQIKMRNFGMLPKINFTT